MALNLPQGQTLFNLVKARYDAASAAASLIFSPTEVAIVRATGKIPGRVQQATIPSAFVPKGVPNIDVEYQLRYCPSLAKKPSADKDKDENNKTSESAFRKPDPFQNPPADLLMTSLPANSAKPSHILVLNKYPIIAQHFILATKANKKQTHFLEEDDLAMTYACLQAWEDGQDGDLKSTCSSSATYRGQMHNSHLGTEEQDRGPSRRRLFAFFNSGEHSGASQPHRHIQFLPVEEMQAQQPASSDWRLLLDTMTVEFEIGQFYNPRLPFQHFAMPIPPNPSPDTLLRIYKSLYDSAAYVVEEQLLATDLAYEPGHVTYVDPHDPYDLPISYNLALTTSTMAICPRRAEGAMVKDDWGNNIGFVSLNGTMLGGTLMVKGEKEWNLFRGGVSGETKLRLVLRTVGIPHGPIDEDYAYQEAVAEEDGIFPVRNLR